jgi:hypothetical protein
MRRKKDDEENRPTVVDSMGLWMRMDIERGGDRDDNLEALWKG